MHLKSPKPSTHSFVGPILDIPDNVWQAFIFNNSNFLRWDPRIARSGGPFGSSWPEVFIFSIVLVRSVVSKILLVLVEKLGP